MSYVKYSSIVHVFQPFFVRNKKNISFENADFNYQL